MAFTEFERAPLQGYTHVYPQNNQAHLGALQYVDLRERDDIRIRVYNCARNIFDPKNEPLVKLVTNRNGVELQVFHFGGLDQIALEPGEYHFSLNPKRMNRESLLRTMALDVIRGVRLELVPAGVVQRLREQIQQILPQNSLGYEILRLVD